MPYFKVKQNNTVIDVLADPNYIVYQQGNDLCVIGKQTEAFGVLSSDASVIYAVEGLRIAPNKGYDVVSLEQIDKTEYDELKALLDENKSVVDDDQQQDNQQEEVMSMSELRQTVLTLKAQNEELAARNELLTECVLELSEIVYA